jgi:S1-C subfamily serine protease
MGLKRPAGVLIASVTAGSPAARAGLKAGDLIVAMDGQPIEDPSTFDYRFATKRLGGVASLSVERQGRTIVVPVALQSAPETPRDEVTIRSRSPFLGATVANLSPALAEELRLDAAAQGVVIVTVEDGSTAAQLGFRPGDVVLEVNGEAIEKSRDLERAAGAATRQWNITLMRGGQRLSVMLRG